MILMEREKRQIIIHKAMEKYGVSVKNNITEALKLYLENDASIDEQIPLFITKPEIHKLKEILKTQRPLCEECGLELQMKQETRDYHGTIYLTAWVCKCGRIEYSDKTPKEWLVILNENRG